MGKTLKADQIVISHPGIAEADNDDFDDWSGSDDKGDAGDGNLIKDPLPRPSGQDGEPGWGTWAA